MTANWFILGDRPHSVSTGGGGATGTVDIDDHDLAGEFNVDIDYESGGNVVSSDGGTLETWVTGSYTASGYEIRATKLGGHNPTGDTLGAWHSLATTRGWRLGSGILGKSCSLRIEIRRASDGTVLDTATITMATEGTGGGEL